MYQEEPRQTCIQVYWKTWLLYENIQSLWKDTNKNNFGANAQQNR